MDYFDKYKQWLYNVADTDIKRELLNMDGANIEDAFYCDLALVPVVCAER